MGMQMNKMAACLSRAALAVTLSASPWVAAQDAPGTDVPEVDSPTEGRAAEVDVVPPVERKNAGEWVILPVPNASPAIGAGLQVMAARFFKADAESQPSVVGAGGGYYSSDTWFAGAGGTYNFAADRWRITGGVAYLDAKYDFYGIGDDAGDNGIAIPLQQSGTAVFVKMLRGFGDNWYAGVGYRYFDSKVGIRLSLPNYPELEEAIRNGVRIVSSGPSVAVAYDTRDLTTNPRTGSYVTFDAIFPTNSFASDEEYQRATVAANRYWSIGDQYVVAGRVSACGASSDAPFFDLCFLGAGKDMRGYTAGRYQDQTMVAAQAELRIQFSPRWGGTVFGGLGQVAPDFGAIRSSNWLPAGGVGVRWMAAPRNKVNIRADIAWGNGEDALFYLNIGEAF